MQQKVQVSSSGGTQSTSGSVRPMSEDSFAEIWKTFAVALKIICYLLLFFALIIAGLTAYEVLANGQPLPISNLVAVLVMCGIASAGFRGAKRLKTGRPPDMATIAFGGFAGFGGLIFIIGVATAFNDPAGLFACLFGAVFIGAGFLARKVVTTVEDAVSGRGEHGTQRIVVDSYSSDDLAHYDVDGQFSATSWINVPANATEEEIEIEKSRWATKNFHRRADWSKGEIVTEDARVGSGGLLIATGIFYVLTTIMITLAILYGDFWVFMAGFLGVFSLIITIASVQRIIHNRKFGESRFIPDELPVRLGGRLSGELRSGVPSNLQSHAPFKVTLSCLRRWEETDFSSRDSDGRTRKVMKSQSLWEQTIEADPIVGLDEYQRTRVAFDLPDDLPQSTITNDREGIFWKLDVHMPLSGLDYRADFRIPVLKREFTIDPGLLPEQAAPA